MPITTSDLAVACAVLQVHCRQCGRTAHFPGPALVRRFGAFASVVEIVKRMRCERDRMPPDGAIILDATWVNHEARARRLSIHAPSLAFRID